MHTEVDVPNPDRLLMPGMYAETTLTLEARDNVLVVPLRGGEPCRATKPRFTS